jgi:biofilm PGA synthesis N-glycosyltransferase PgaC
MEASLTVVIPAYNEASVLPAKIENTCSLEYPSSKKKIIVITDGSNDDISGLGQRYPEITHLHKPERQGKMAAIDRAMTFVDTDLVVFTDANTTLNSNALLAIARHFENPLVGMVAGEKRILQPENAGVEVTEGLYWKYESWLKKLDSDVGSVVGAAGELFAMRTNLFVSLPPDTILDDFMLSMHVLQQGFKIVYEPNAYAMESSSLDLREEWKRKVRISAGGIQSILRSLPLFNVAKFGIISYSFMVHRVARWTIAPFAVLMLLASSLVLGFYYPVFLPISLAALASSALTAFAISNGKMWKSKLLFPIVYFLFMNFSVVAGWIRFARGSQSAIWEKAVRK